MVSRPEAESLFRALLRTDRIADRLAVAADTEAIRASLRPLARSTDLVVTSAHVNENRVDIEAGTDTEHWHVVYFVDDTGSVTDLHVWSRPPLILDHVGLAVVLNGPSGAGKSSLMGAVADADPRPWVIFDEPWLGAVRQPYLIWPETAPDLHRGYLVGIAALAAEGNLVLLSTAGNSFATVTEAFADVATLRVGLSCSVPALYQRELGREGRQGGLAEASLNIHDGWTYDLTLDSTDLRPAALAEIVLEAVTHTLEPL